MAGVSYRQLDYWLREGYVHPEMDVNPGSGRPRRWAPADVDRLIAVAQKLRDAHQLFEDFRDGVLWNDPASRANLERNMA